MPEITHFGPGKASDNTEAGRVTWFDIDMTVDADRAWLMAWQEINEHTRQGLLEPVRFSHYEQVPDGTFPLHWTAAGLNQAQADTFVNALAALIEPVKTHFLWRPLLRDPNDEMVLEVAVNGKADAVVTFNLRDYGAVPETFNIEVLTPATAIKRVRNE
jgi:hypothetical protein